jgi:hypothetical protein
VARAPRPRIINAGKRLLIVTKTKSTAREQLTV